MKIAVVGSKEFSDLPKVSSRVLELSRDDTVVTGEAPGVDEKARQTARISACGLKVIEQNGKPQGEHHQEKLEACDRAVIFWNGESEGTRDLINRALEMELPTEVHVEP